MDRIFVDTDVCFDLLSARIRFHDAAEHLFSLADRKQIIVGVSTLSFANLDYLLKGSVSGNRSRQILAQFRTMVNVVPVDDKMIDLSLSSSFSDFEDAIQYHAAIESGYSLLITRNVKDYKKAAIPVMTPSAYLGKWEAK